MSVPWHSLSEARIALAVILTVLALAGPAAHAQNVNGSLSVSATILPPIARQETRLTAFSIARDGIAQLETTAPVAASVSQIVMWSVSSSANGFVAVEQAPISIGAAHAPEPEGPTSLPGMRATRMRFGVNLGSNDGWPTDTSSRDVIVRIHYLIVPGT
jgi:hypothetical protein